MKESNYYLYIIPQTGEVIRCKDFDREVETKLCTKYGRIFSVSGYSKAVSIVSMVEEQYGEIYPTHGSRELRLDNSFICEKYEKELAGMNHVSKETSW